ncbi:hypothetical protein RHMOL_Rhmol06G0158600 [Rhododendron molle]|uniref:Uncharacterized protein n=1 Tax=Rhododendron molle TaxID=49168 RepID=A0ACC0NDD9_RHOML|nr:hypothetical protein RHMOL_Rhmol06G0158600 [Rhododendron molle]
MGDKELSILVSLENWMILSSGHMEKMTNSFGYDKELSARRTQVPDELLKLDITFTEKFKLSAVICQEEQMVDNFYGIKSDERQAYAEAILSGIVFGESSLIDEIFRCGGVASGHCCFCTYLTVSAYYFWVVQLLFLHLAQSSSGYFCSVMFDNFSLKHDVSVVYNVVSTVPKLECYFLKFTRLFSAISEV